ncbi:PilN domain-containing protein [uncultured Limimaricola sp.]|uniref:PilN domain-containing protein n=1 Tax=uncultured Limimaricola sp. TaxID=2211667 RepID=UPI0030F9CE3B
MTVALTRTLGKLRAAGRLLFPTSVFTAGLPPRHVLTLQLERPLIGAADLATVTAAARHGRPVDLVLPRDAFLEKSVTLPRAARRQAAAAIAVQMRQEMPAQGHGLVWRAAPAERRGDRLVYAVLLMKQDDLAALRRAVDNTGASLRSVRTMDTPGIMPFLDNRRLASRPERRWSLALVALVALTAGWTMFAQWRELSHLARDIAGLRQEITDLADRAVQAQQEAVSREASRATLASDLACFRAEYHRLLILSNLTTLLTEGVWLAALSLEGDDLRLVGFAEGDVTAVVAAIRDAPWALDVELDGPVVVDPVSRQNRFQLRVALRGEVPA